jgi:hypothetical protein
MINLFRTQDNEKTPVGPGIVVTMYMIEVDCRLNGSKHTNQPFFLRHCQASWLIFWLLVLFVVTVLVTVKFSLGTLLDLNSLKVDCRIYSTRTVLWFKSEKKQPDFTGSFTIVCSIWREYIALYLEYK